MLTSVGRVYSLVRGQKWSSQSYLDSIFINNSRKNYHYEKIIFSL